jgi:hypothetical protein
LTLHSRPRDLVGGYFVTGDGYEVHERNRGRRRRATQLPARHYGSRKTGLARAATGGGAWVIEAGGNAARHHDPRRESRHSDHPVLGGRPNDKGDFSGVAYEQLLRRQRRSFVPDFGDDGQRQHG